MLLDRRGLSIWGSLPRRSLSWRGCVAHCCSRVGHCRPLAGAGGVIGVPPACGNLQRKGLKFLKTFTSAVDEKVLPPPFALFTSDRTVCDAMRLHGPRGDLPNVNPSTGRRTQQQPLLVGTNGTAASKHSETEHVLLPSILETHVAQCDRANLVSPRSCGFSREIANSL